jgi:hypothetical protein
VRLLVLEGEKSAEKNGPSGWLTRSRFCPAKRDLDRASGFFCNMWNNRIDSCVLMWESENRTTSWTKTNNNKKKQIIILIQIVT